MFTKFSRVSLCFGFERRLVILLFLKIFLLFPSMVVFYIRHAAVREFYGVTVEDLVDLVCSREAFIQYLE